MKLIKIRFRELLPFAKVVKSVVTAVVIKAGIKFRDWQEGNILAIFVTFTVLYNGTDCSEMQLLNIFDIFVTLIVLNNGTDCSEEQF